MLHHVRPEARNPPPFAPNAILEVSPEFLDSVIRLVKRRGYDLVTLDEALCRLGNIKDPPFAVFTLDDAYRDNITHALPVFKRHDCPFTIFASPAIQDGTCEIWWRGLEAAIARNDRITGDIEGAGFDLLTVSDQQKNLAWARLYWPVRTMQQQKQREWIRNFCEANGVDLGLICRNEAMSWAELRQIAAEPLCEIGAHTINHYALGLLPQDVARRELIESGERLAAELGQKPRFFAYPYGDAASAGAREFRLAEEAGYEAAVTTRKGLVFTAHSKHRFALPRLSLNGDFQNLRYTKVLLDGSAFALWNRFRQLNVA